MDKLDLKIARDQKINKTYIFPARVVVKDVPLDDLNKLGEIIHYTSRMIYLVPEISTQATFFFDAWLPGLAYKDEAKNQIMHFEVAVMFPHPLFRVLRCGVCRKNKNYPNSHHLVLISSETSEDILASLDGQVFELKVLPDLDAEAALG